MKGKKKGPAASSNWGKVGNRLRNKKLTKEQRSELARKAINARWEKVRAAKAKSKNKA